jgi:hypothetical protein
MLLTPLPFDYIKKIDPGDRIRRARKAESESRLRRLPRETEK